MLYIFVEGPDDYNYFEKIFGESFGEYKIIKYASMPQVKLNNFINISKERETKNGKG